MTRDPVARRAVPRGGRATRLRAIAEVDRYDTIEVARIVNVLRHDVAFGAVDGQRQARRSMGRVRARQRSGIVEIAVARTALSAPVTEIDVPVQMHRAARERRSGRVRFAMA
jgi:hypothetical protein